MKKEETKRPNIGRVCFNKYGAIVGAYVTLLLLTAIGFVRAGGSPPFSGTTRGRTEPVPTATPEEFSIWFGSFFLPPSGATLQKVLERVSNGEGKQDMLKRLYDAFGKDYQGPAKDFMARQQDLKAAFRKKPLEEADARKAVQGIGNAQKRMLRAAEKFWNALRKELGEDLFGKVISELHKGGLQPRAPLMSVAVLISPLSPEINFMLGQHLEIQQAQMERFRKQYSEEKMEKAAENFIKATQKLIHDYSQSKSNDWTEYFRRAEKQVDEETKITLMEVEMWQVFNDALSAGQVRDYWVIFFWEKDRSFYLPLLISPPALTTP
ncbi:MAG: hypothetical protein V2G42_03425 [bacterium JZ-2024 1]